ncbi:hypothetical protein [Kaistia sp. MMO-174]|uniref:hypothetical protein n=1 Tax=Kaistia sp. MMO-174 TaxID=3081256 RepID=UPI0030181DA0
MDVKVLGPFSMADLIGGSNGGNDPRPKPQNRPIHEAQVETLRELFARYQTEKPFKVGQLVTPRAGFNLHGVGEPCVVLEMVGFDEALTSDEEFGSPGFGARLDLRIATLANGSHGEHAIMAYWNESWQFEPYTGPGASVAEGQANG